ncbi:MAG: murein hydrolase activator EnvC family protein [Gemmatimonadales bacterium]
MRVVSLGLLVLLCTLVTPLFAQVGLDRQIRENQARLDSIRRQRSDLEGELQRLRGRARDITTEIRNIERQKNLTNRVVNELDRQMAAMSTKLDTITMDLLLSQDALAETQAVLERRLSDIYKRGPLYAFHVLLAAESFGDLLSRYKYLHLISRQDRALTTEVEDLHRRILAQRREQVVAQRVLIAQREQRSTELRRFVSLERQRQRNLRDTRASQLTTSSVLDSLTRAESELSRLLASLEVARRRAISSGARAELAPNISTADLGTLPWPVTGNVIYRFGRAPGPGGTRIRYEGVGIATPSGTPVRAVAGGRVEIANAFGTYGPSVIIEHGGGFHTVYLYLSGLDVVAGQTVVSGQIIGRSGGSGSESGPHLEFQIRQAAPGSTRPIALDPENWLSKHR